MKNDLIAVEAEFEEYLRDIRNKEGERKKKERKTKRQVSKHLSMLWETKPRRHRNRARTLS